MDQIIQAFKEFIEGVAYRLQAIEANITSLIDSRTGSAERVATLEATVATLSKRVAELESSRSSTPLIAKLNAEIKAMRDDYFNRNPTAKSVKIEVLPGYFQVWDRARLTTPVWVEIDSRIRANHNVTIRASTDSGVGAGGHAHLVFQINRDDGKVQEFQLFCGRDAGGRTVFAIHPHEVGHPDPLHAIPRNDEVDAFLWLEQNINGEGGHNHIGRHRRRLNPAPAVGSPNFGSARPTTNPADR